MLYLAVYSPTLGFVAAVAAGFACWKGWPHTPLGRFRGEHGRDGWATGPELHRHLSPKAPSTVLGRAIVGTRVPVSCAVTHEESVAILGGPRSGKTLLLGALVRRHVGAVVASSARLDLLLATIGSRARGRTAWVFAPEGVGGAAGRLLGRLERAGWLRWLRWSPVAGCEDPQVASERAAALVGATDAGSADDATWLESATTVVRCFLRAAALGGLDMATVYRWITSGLASREAFDLLIEHGAEDWAGELAAELLSASEKGAASVLRAARLSVQFMAQPSVAATCCPEPGEPTLDVRDLIDSRGALYLVGSDRKFSGLTPLLSCLTSHVFDESMRLAKEQKSGRLPVPMMMGLDEIKTTSKVALDDWLAVAGGFGIHIVWSCQNPAQLRERWGAEGASAILDNSTTKVVFGGVDNPLDLQRFTDRCGDRRETIPNDPDKRTEWRPVLPGHRLTGMPKFRALLLARECPKATVVSTPRWRVTLPALADRVRPVLPARQVALEAPRRPLVVEATRQPIPLPPAARDVEATKLARQEEAA